MASDLAAAVPRERIHRLTVEQYRQMARARILTPADRIELLDGWLVEKTTKNSPHRIATRRVRVALEKVMVLGWYVDSQEPIATPDSEPEPDAAVIRGKTEDYRDQNPPADCVGLVVEVADDSVGRDRETKGRIYARAFIPWYWLVNLVDHKIEVYSEPSGPSDSPSYGARMELGPGDAIDVVLDDVVVGRIAVADLLP